MKGETTIEFVDKVMSHSHGLCGLMTLVRIIFGSSCCSAPARAALAIALLGNG